MANQAGFSSIEDYVKHLEKSSKTAVTKRTPKAKKAPKDLIIHSVLVVDRSGSMSGSKLKSAIEGVNAEIASLREAKGAEVLFTLVHFDSRPVIAYDRESISSVSSFNCHSGGSTYLYGTLVKVLDRLKTSKLPSERILVKIFTDGEDTDSTFSEKEAASSLIKDAKNFECTVTFIGTANDTNMIIQNLHIDASNTLVHNNTGAGMQQAFTKSREATMAYVGASLDGAESSELMTGFFTKTLIK